MHAAMDLVIPYYWLSLLLLSLLIWLARLDASTHQSLVIWAMSGMFMDLLTPYILALDGSIANHLWYMTWVMCYFVTLILILTMHNYRQQPVSNISFTLCGYALAMMLLQLSRYADRIVLGTDKLGALYQFGVPAINFAILISVSGWFISVVVKRKKNV